MTTLVQDQTDQGLLLVIGVVTLELLEDGAEQGHLGNVRENSDELSAD